MLIVSTGQGQAEVITSSITIVLYLYSPFDGQLSLPFCIASDDEIDTKGVENLPRLFSAPRDGADDLRMFCVHVLVSSTTTYQSSFSLDIYRSHTLFFRPELELSHDRYFIILSSTPGP